MFTSHNGTTSRIFRNFAHEYDLSYSNYEATATSEDQYSTAAQIDEHEQRSHIPTSGQDPQDDNSDRKLRDSGVELSTDKHGMYHDNEDLYFTPKEEEERKPRQTPRPATNLDYYVPPRVPSRSSPRLPPTLPNKHLKERLKTKKRKRAEVEVHLPSGYRSDKDNTRADRLETLEEDEQEEAESKVEGDTSEDGNVSREHISLSSATSSYMTSSKLKPSHYIPTGTPSHLTSLLTNTHRPTTPPSAPAHHPPTPHPKSRTFLTNSNTLIPFHPLSGVPTPKIIHEPLPRPRSQHVLALKHTHDQFSTIPRPSLRMHEGQVDLVDCEIGAVRKITRAPPGFEGRGMVVEGTGGSEWPTYTHTRGRIEETDGRGMNGVGDGRSGGKKEGEEEVSAMDVDENVGDDLNEGGFDENSDDDDDDMNDQIFTATTQVNWPDEL